MFIHNTRSLVYPAFKSKKAIGAFNVHNLEIFEAILRAAQKKRAPVIIQTTPKSLKHLSVYYFKKLVESAQKIFPKVAVALHLDHGDTLELIEKCLEAGYSSVMFDGSKLSFEENVKMTKKVKKMAQRFRVSIEAELGEMPKVGQRIKEQNLTDPEKARIFLKETKVDFLAVSIGTKHGMLAKNGTEHINFEHLEKIHNLINVPLVLHGASGVGRNELKRARKFGIAKVNFDTAIRKIFSLSLRKYLQTHQEEDDPRVYLEQARKSVEKLIREKMEVLSK